MKTEMHSLLLLRRSATGSPMRHPLQHPVSKLSSAVSAAPPRTTKPIPKSVSTAAAVVAVAAMASGSILGFYHYYYYHDSFGGSDNHRLEGYQRALSFYSLAIPKYLVYRYHQIIQSPQPVWDALDQRTSQQGLALILQLKGFYIKCGQMCASNIGDAFPVVWQDTMSVLQDRVPPQDYEAVILPILQSELLGGRGTNNNNKYINNATSLDQIFSFVDRVPIGSASIGQVHRATLLLSNPLQEEREEKQQQQSESANVVIKICTPHVERLLKGDVRTIRSFCEIAQPVHVPALKEVEEQFQTEFDFVTEARNLQLVRDNLTRAGLCGDGPGRLCVLPRPRLEYCTRRVLVMEELHGEKLVDVLQRDAKKWTALLEQSSRNNNNNTETIDERSLSSEEFEKILAGLDKLRRTQNAWNRLYNWTVGSSWLFGGRTTTTTSPLPIESRADLPLNPAKLVDDLLTIHGHQVLVDGRFNADCHPGNILLCRDSNGEPQLGLIDYGQVKTLTKNERHLLARIIIALDDNDKDEVVRLMILAGFRSKRMDPDVIFIYAKVSYDQDSKELTNGKHIQLFMEDIQSRDPIINLPKNYIMVGRASILLRGLAHTLKQSRSVAKVWRPLAEQVLKHDL